MHGCPRKQCRNVCSGYRRRDRGDWPAPRCAPEGEGYRYVDPSCALPERAARKPATPPPQVGRDMTEWFDARVPPPLSRIGGCGTLVVDHVRVAPGSPCATHASFEQAVEFVRASQQSDPR